MNMYFCFILWLILIVNIIVFFLFVCLIVLSLNFICVIFKHFKRPFRLVVLFYLMAGCVCVFVYVCVCAVTTFLQLICCVCTTTLANLVHPFPFPGAMDVVETLVSVVVWRVHTCLAERPNVAICRNHHEPVVAYVWANGLACDWLFAFLPVLMALHMWNPKERKKKKTKTNKLIKLKDNVGNANKLFLPVLVMKHKHTA